MNFEENIIQVFRNCTEGDIHDGLNWYPRANLIARQIAENNAIVGAGVIAALSPNLNWDINVSLAREILKTKIYTGHYRNTLEKAKRIINGENPLTVLHGWKTVNFYDCILNSGNTNSVCIDRHAIAICLGRPATDRERRELRATNSGLQKYNRYADAYRSVSLELNIKPSQLQAITWVSWRRNDIGQENLFPAV